MTYKHLNTDELSFIASSFERNDSVSMTANILHRSRQTINKVYQFLRGGHTIIDYWHQYKTNKSCCGRHLSPLSDEDVEYINRKVDEGWTPDTIIGRGEHRFGMSTRTLYRRFKRDKQLPEDKLPMKGKRHPNGYVEVRGKQRKHVRHLSERYTDHPNFTTEFGHFEGDTMVGKDHQGAVMTLVERKSKLSVILNVVDKSADAIEQSTLRWLSRLPKHLVKSMTFDNGKEFANWQTISNETDVDIYFADIGAPNQRGLNENTNGLLRRDGISKKLNLNFVTDEFVAKINRRRNNIPRKSLGYQTPIEVFLQCMTDADMQNFV